MNVLDILEGKEPCTCICHTKGMSVRHVMACCDLTYKKYIIDGKVDVDKWNKLRLELNNKLK